jgi:hypothetical protein
MPKVITMLIPGSPEPVNRYPECPHAGDSVLWFTHGVLLADHLCIYPGTPSPITCGERNRDSACPMDYTFSDDFLKALKKDQESKDRYQKQKRSRK